MRDIDYACLATTFLGCAIGGLIAKFVTPTWTGIAVLTLLYFVCIFKAWQINYRRVAELQKEIAKMQKDLP